MKNPYCPVCRKRVEPRTECGFGGIENDVIIRIHEVEIKECSECGILFDPHTSERLVPKCECGEDLQPRNGYEFSLTLPGQNAKCWKCKEVKP